MAMKFLARSKPWAPPSEKSITMVSSGAAKQITIPAAISLVPGTREITVVWPRKLMTAKYDVDIHAESVLTIGTPYTFAVRDDSTKTQEQCVLQYTNSGIVLSLGAGNVLCLAYPRG